MTTYKVGTNPIKKTAAYLKLRLRLAELEDITDAEKKAAWENEKHPGMNWTTGLGGAIALGGAEYAGGGKENHGLINRIGRWVF
jgi:hypothetical protein